MFQAKIPAPVAGLFWGLWIVLLLYVFNDTLGMGNALSELIDNAQNREVPNSIDWQIGLILGIFGGSMAASFFTGNFKIRLASDSGGNWLGALFKTLFGGILGGFLLMSGILLAGETIEGQLIAAIQLSGGAWLFLCAMILSGIALAVVLSNRGKMPDGNEK